MARELFTHKAAPCLNVMPLAIRNVHPWMKSFIGVVPHPYFVVTGGGGSFRIDNLPPGDYTIEAWHEKFGAQETQVTVGPNEPKEVGFSFQG